MGTYWKPSNRSAGDVGPASGAVPLLTPAPDGIVDFEDLFTFTRMWNWYYITLASLGSSLAKQDGRMFWKWTDTDNGLRLDVNVENASDLAMGHVMINYNDQALSVKQVDQGDLLSNSQSSCVLLPQYDRSGSVEITFSKLAHVNQSAELDPNGTLFSVVFEQKQTGGESAVQIASVDLRTARNKPVAINVESGDELNLAAIPESCELANYPNPFNSRTLVYFQLPSAGFVDLEVINVLGQPVRTLVHKEFQAGQHSVTWDGTNNRGIDAGSGMYMLRMTTGDQVLLKKLLLLK